MQKKIDEYDSDEPRTGARVATDGGEETKIGTVAEPGDDEFPAVEYTGEHRAECTGCGRDGPLTLDDDPVILHTWECPRGADRDAADAAADTDSRDRPTRSEPADFGGGEASGMDDLGDPAETVDSDAGTDAAGGGLGTVTGWGGSTEPDTGNEDVDETPL
jgi:predicted small lipoprotein YifL